MLRGNIAPDCAVMKASATEPRLLQLDISNDELARRRAVWMPPRPHAERGYGAMFSQHVGQANDGCDFDVLGPGLTLVEPRFTDRAPRNVAQRA